MGFAYFTCRTHLKFLMEVHLYLKIKDVRFPSLARPTLFFSDFTLAPNTKLFTHAISKLKNYSIYPLRQCSPISVRPPNASFLPLLVRSRCPSRMSPDQSARQLDLLQIKPIQLSPAQLWSTTQLRKRSLWHYAWCHHQRGRLSRERWQWNTMILYWCDSLGVGAHVKVNHDLGGETTCQDLIRRLCGRAEGGPATQQAILLPPASLRCYRPTRGYAISMLVTSRFALPPASRAQSGLRPVLAFS
jgi:hypothetical protein